MLSWRRNESIAAEGGRRHLGEDRVPKRCCGCRSAPSTRRRASRTVPSASASPAARRAATRQASCGPDPRSRSARRSLAELRSRSRSSAVTRNSATVTWRKSSSSPRELPARTPAQSRTRSGAILPRPEDLERGVPATASSSTRAQPATPERCRQQELETRAARVGALPSAARPAPRAARSAPPPRARRGTGRCRGVISSQERLQRLRDRELRPVDGTAGPGTAEAPPGRPRRGEPLQGGAGPASSDEALRAGASEPATGSPYGRTCSSSRSRVT